MSNGSPGPTEGQLIGQLAAQTKKLELHRGPSVSDSVFGRLYRASTASFWFFWWPALVLISMVVVAGLQGTLLVEGGIPQVWRDLGQLLRLEAATTDLAAFPLLRDYPSLLLTLVTAASVPVVRGYLIALDRLVGGRPQAPGGRYYGLEVWSDKWDTLAAARNNAAFRFMAIRYISPLLLFSCFIIGLLFSLSQDRGGMFHYFAPEGSDPGWVSIDGYRMWWASPRDPFRFGSILWITVGSVGTYFAFLASMNGWVTLLLLRSIVRSEGLAIDPVNLDQRYGFAALRLALQYGLVASSILAFGLTGVIYLISPFSPIWAVALLGLGGIVHNIWMIAASFYYTHNGVMGYKFRAKEFVLQNGNGGEGSVKLGDRLDAVPSVPVKVWAATAAALSFGSTLLAVGAQILGK